MSRDGPSPKPTVPTHKSAHATPQLQLIRRGERTNSELTANMSKSMRDSCHDLSAGHLSKAASQTAWQRLLRTPPAAEQLMERWPWKAQLSDLKPATISKTECCAHDVRHIAHRDNRKNQLQRQS